MFNIGKSYEELLCICWGGVFLVFNKYTKSNTSGTAK